LLLAVGAVRKRTDCDYLLRPALNTSGIGKKREEREREREGKEDKKTATKKGDTSLARQGFASNTGEEEDG